MARLLLRIGILFLVISSSLVLSRAVGGTAANPLAAMFTEKSLPNGEVQVCWHGVCPGQSTVNEAKVILDADTDFSFDTERWKKYGKLCWNEDKQSSVFGLNLTACLAGENDHVEGLNLFFPEIYSYPTSDIGRVPMRLGELMNLWGNPITYDPGYCGFGTLLFSNRLLAQFYYQRYLKRNGEVDYGNYFVLEPDPAQSGVYTLVIPASTLGTDTSDYIPWRGFGTSQGIINFACGG